MNGQKVCTKKAKRALLWQFKTKLNGKKIVWGFKLFLLSHMGTPSFPKVILTFCLLWSPFTILFWVFIQGVKREICLTEQCLSRNQFAPFTLSTNLQHNFFTPVGRAFDCGKQENKTLTWCPWALLNFFWCQDNTWVTQITNIKGPVLSLYENMGVLSVLSN